MRTQSSDRSAADATLLIRTGACLFGVSLLNGFVIEATPLPRLALSAHLVGLMGAAFLFGFGAVWPQLTFRPRTSRVAALLAVYGFAAGWVVYLAAAVTGVAGLFPMAGGAVRGPAPLEMLMSVALLTVALALFALVILVFRHAGADAGSRNGGRPYGGR
jgi:(hydroxyamino)benzene mutase